MKVVKGLDTFRGRKELPSELALSREWMEKWRDTKNMLNEKGIALIPYCFKCRIPLNWIYDDESILFICPECGAEWKKEDSWQK